MEALSLLFDQPLEKIKQPQNANNCHTRVKISPPPPPKKIIIQDSLYIHHFLLFEILR